MKSWLDTSALVSLYVPEARSERVARLVVRGREPIPFSQLHELELVNALRLLKFRGEAGAAQVEATLARIAEDLHAGTLARATIDWPAVFGTAVELADRHTSRLGCRSLDLVHVAAAVVFGARRFVTADRRQAALARRAGLAIARIG